jgi:hypothetical protein
LSYLRHHHLALLALFLALGGTSYAAVALPANSVGTKQLRNKAVTPAKVAPATAKLFRGERGLRGLRGEAGTPGDQGPAGPAGPSDAYAAVDRAGGQGLRTVSVTVPAGDYVAVAKAQVTNTSAMTAYPITCQLAVSSDSTSAGIDSSSASLGIAQVETLPNQIFSHMPNGGTISEACGSNSVLALRVEELRLTATRIGALHP